MTSKPVIIEEYNEKWQIMFGELKDIIAQHLGDLPLSIEHVGSTAVPGLPAKPIIDMDIVIPSVNLLSQVIDKLSELGYWHEGDLGLPGREAFARNDNRVPYDAGMNEKMTHHLYVCSKGSVPLNEHLMFRDILRKHPALVKDYADLKMQLAEQFKYDRAAYTEAKTSFIRSVLSNGRS
ncbi:GrpB family protein [Paenibacillus sp. JCM 10914]|uniref:GrpB family protein n=1 Tax=Paenibacillus sp. JCM 10914 TaxID=1236974 RepID=UPI0003CC86FC|nr:GrpB family protein [Paenibacillus sp. JCM 10914]GAE05189.1 glutamate-rich protein grpB [Paenibacillus sp. JCM 10914]